MALHHGVVSSTDSFLPGESHGKQAVLVSLGEGPVSGTQGLILERKSGQEVGEELASVCVCVGEWAHCVRHGCRGKGRPSGRSVDAVTRSVLLIPSEVHQL